MGFASHYMAYSVPSTSTWCHLGGSYIHIVCTFLQNEGLYKIMLYDRISIMPKVKVIDMNHFAGINRLTPGKRERHSQEKVYM